MKNMQEFTVKNLNREKILKQVLKLGKISDIRFDEDCLRFKVPLKLKKRVEKILEKNGMAVLESRQVGTIAFLKKSILRWGVIIPIILFCVFSSVLNFFIFKYQVVGNELVSTQEVLQILEDNNVSGIILKSKINALQIENALQKIDKVSLVSVIIRGNTLLINIKEKVYNEEYEEHGEFAPICSDYDGIITQITPIQGTVLVKVGQTVKKGQQLVVPQITDTSGQTLFVKPMADIKADVFITTTQEVEDNTVQMIDTGKSFARKEITICGLPIYQETHQVELTHCRTEQTLNYLCDGLILPIIIKTTTFYEQECHEIENYFQKNKKQILDECKQKTRQLVKDYEIIKDEYQTVTNMAGINRITSTVVVNKSIC
ncbi:MAG: sporulation protein YqfD [Clostridia bacterium]|nr:sporulation protein YqfD [Clostridia bacterium]